MRRTLTDVAPLDTSVCVRAADKNNIVSELLFVLLLLILDTKMLMIKPLYMLLLLQCLAALVIKYNLNYL